MKKTQFAEDIVKEVRDDYERRCSQRRPFEAQWQLNTNFVMGNQYCFVNVKGEVEDSEKDYFWQEREVFNHIASIFETRLAKLSSVRPTFVVSPASSDESDVKTAKVSGKILDSAYHTLGIDSILTEATNWSELTGTAFYKLSWDSEKGKKIGEKDGREIFEGDVRVDVCPPYEIYPDNIYARDLDECNSIIHAKAVHVEDVYRIWGKKVKGEPVQTVSYDKTAFSGGLGVASATVKASVSERENLVTVIERYVKPTFDKPRGELAIVAGGELLYYSDMPEIAGERKFPFIRQISISNAGCFYGASMVERCIPVQRAYNAVKNRKHEFLNRIAMGVLAVEDGSVDTAELEEEGLSPGKILVYRQGSTPPVFMSPGSIPDAFTQEENRLLSEFVDISGISEIMRSSSVPSSVTSGTAIQMLIEQDDTRINVTAQSIREVAVKIAEGILKLYKQNATHNRLSRFVGEEGDVELICWTGSDINSDSVVLASANEINNSVASKRNTMMELLRMGLLHDENGKLSDVTRHKILEVFGYGGWEQTKHVASLHITRANRENARLGEELRVSEIDDHELHIQEHTRFMLSSEFDKEEEKFKQDMLEHLREHKRFGAEEKSMQKGEGNAEKQIQVA